MKIKDLQNSASSQAFVNQSNPELSQSKSYKNLTGIKKFKSHGLKTTNEKYGLPLFTIPV